MTSLAHYEAARRELQLASSIDEAKDIKDKAEAMRIYARQANDYELESWSLELRLRAQKRLGEMSKALETAQGARTDKPCPTDETKSQALEQAGISRSSAHRYEKLADQPEDEFERHVEQKKEQLKKRYDRERTHHSSATEEHYTPDHIIESVMRVLGDIDVDPCADPDHGVCAQNHFDAEMDGLGYQWHGRVYMNPPYGTSIRQWVQKLIAEYQAGHATEAIALVPARPDTQWWGDFGAATVCFWSGRLVFKGNADAAPFPSALFYIGESDDRFVTEFAPKGRIYRRVYD